MTMTNEEYLAKNGASIAYYEQKIAKFEIDNAEFLRRVDDAITGVTDPLYKLSQSMRGFREITPKQRALAEHLMRERAARPLP